MLLALSAISCKSEKVHECILNVAVHSAVFGEHTVHVAHAFPYCSVETERTFVGLIVIVIPHNKYSVNKCNVY